MAQGAARQLACRSPVLLERAPLNVDIGYGGVALPEVRARWTAPDGTLHRGYVQAPTGTRRGRTVRIWVDQAGHLTGPPLRSEQVTGQEVLAMVIALFALGGILLWVSALVLQAVDRRRLAAWDTEWQAIGPRWSSLR